MRSLHTLVIDDDHLIGRIICTFLQNAGHTTVHVDEAQHAAARYLREDFDLVLVDRQMPGMDGLAATSLLREQQRMTGWRPIIMLSGSASTEEQVAALNAGCDDFIAKPINFKILEAKINSFQRIAELQQKIREQNLVLKQYANAEAEERRIASFLMDRLMRTEQLDNGHIQHMLKPTSGVSGDLLLANTSGCGDIYVMLADATGHGLPAALTLIPVSQTFYAMTAKGFQLETIARELNHQHRAYSPPDRFVAALMAVFRPREGTLEVWNGGLPPALLIGSDGEILRRIKSRNLALGILSNQDFEYRSESVLLNAENRLLMYSDGLIEAETAHASPFGSHGLERCIAQYPPQALLSGIEQELQQYLDGLPLHDDMSCLILTCTPAPDTGGPQAPGTQELKQIAEKWHLQLQLGPSQLRRLDLEPLLASFCASLGLDEARKGVFSLVLRELLTNALEHGLLGLDSNIKNGPEGFENYLNARSAALSELSHGQIEIEIAQSGDLDENTLIIRVIDSGPGYDWQQLRPPAQEPGAELYHGRGLQLIRSLARKTQIRGRGNDISVTLAW